VDGWSLQMTDRSRKNRQDKKKLVNYVAPTPPHKAVRSASLRSGIIWNSDVLNNVDTCFGDGD